MHKILLVEDDETIRQQVKKIMEQWGFEVIAVDDFIDVLGTFVQNNPHLILILFIMATIGARKFVRCLRSLSCFYPHEIKLWTSSWLSIWEEMTM